MKMLSAESKQGVHEFLTEIDTISNIKHPNLVELVGCCVQGKNRILVYEYVENNSLDRALLGNIECQIACKRFINSFYQQCQRATDKKETYFKWAATRMLFFPFSKILLAL